jgi:HEAT repeat protein
MAIVARLEDKESSIQKAAIEALGQQSALPHEAFMAIVARLEDKESSIQAAVITTLGKQSVLSQKLALPYKILKDITAQLENEDFNIRLAAIEALGQQSALPYEILQAITALLKDKNEDVFFQMDVIRALSQQSTLPYEFFKYVAAQLESDSDYIRETAETALRRHGEFYCSLFKGSYIKSIYRILLQKSFEEQLSWYVDDGNIYINMPEDILRISIEEHDDIKATIETARPANFPTR